MKIGSAAASSLLLLLGPLGRATVLAGPAGLAGYDPDCVGEEKDVMEYAHYESWCTDLVRRTGIGTFDECMYETAFEDLGTSPNVLLMNHVENYCPANPAGVDGGLGDFFSHCVDDVKEELQYDHFKDHPSPQLREQINKDLMDDVVKFCPSKASVPDGFSKECVDRCVDEFEKHCYEITKRGKGCMDLMLEKRMMSILKDLCPNEYGQRCEARRKACEADGRPWATCLDEFRECYFGPGRGGRAAGEASERKLRGAVERDGLGARA